MYVIVQHDIRNPETAFPRGQAMIDGVAPPTAPGSCSSTPASTGPP